MSGNDRRLQQLAHCLGQQQPGASSASSSSGRGSAGGVAAYGPLDEGQLASFEAFGFVVLKPFSKAEVAAIVEETAGLFAATVRPRVTALHRACSSVQVQHSVERSEMLTRLFAEDSRVAGAVAQLLGSDFVFSGSELERAGEGSHHDPAALKEAGVPPHYNEHGWHSDRQGRREIEFPRLKLMCYLTSTQAETGALRLLPGSHRAPFHHTLAKLQQTHPQLTCTEEWAAATFGCVGSALPAFTFEAEPGECILFNQSCVRNCRLFAHAESRV